MNDRTAFAKLAHTLAPWMQQRAFVGGWGHRLYRLHPNATTPNYRAKRHSANCWHDLLFNATIRLDRSSRQGRKASLKGLT
jgi:hypothetical protein